MTTLIARLSAAALVTILLVGCGQTVSPAPSAPAIGSSSPSAGAASPGAASPGAASPGASDCPIAATDGPLPSDRLVSVAVRDALAGDAVIFSFARPGAFVGPNRPTGHLEEATPPFTFDPSGEPLTIGGQRFIRVRFEGQTLADDAGAAVYTGDRRIPIGRVAAEVVNEGAYEGVSSWLIGFDPAACVSLDTDPSGLDVAVIIALPQAPSS